MRVIYFTSVIPFPSASNRVERRGAAGIAISDDDADDGDAESSLGLGQAWVICQAWVILVLAERRERSPYRNQVQKWFALRLE